MKKEGYQIIALEQDEKSVDYRKVKVGENVAIILGEEVNGLDKKILKSNKNICIKNFKLVTIPNFQNI